jgi:hypothetical protein
LLAYGLLSDYKEYGIHNRLKLKRPFKMRIRLCF